MTLAKGNSIEDDTVMTTYLAYIMVLRIVLFYEHHCIIVPLSAKLVFFLLQSTEMHIYTDFLRLVLEILNAILTYALPRNPEVSSLTILVIHVR